MSKQATATPAAAPAPANPVIMSRPSDFAYVDPRSIKRRHGWNNRFDFGDIELLAGSIKVTGVKVPLTVKRTAEGFELVDGDRRLTAIEKLLQEGHVFDKGVPVKIQPKEATDRQSRIDMFVANTGKPLLPLEEAAAFKELIDDGMTVAQVSVATGRSVQHINHTISLLTADDSVKVAVSDGTLSGTEAKDIAQRVRGDKAAQREIVAAARQAKDKKERRKVVQQKVRAAQEAHGRARKIRALTDEQLSELGAKVAKQLEAVLKDAGLTDTQLMAEVAGDNKLAAAFSLGAIKALRAAAGVKEVLTV